MKRRIIRYNSALISVLCLIFTAGILLASTLSLSKSGTFTVAAHVKMQRSMLISEGVANRVQWLLAADRNLHPDDKPGTVDYTAYEYDRFMGDAVIHTMDYYGENVQVQIWDAVKGFDMSQSSYAAAINRISSQEDAGDDVIDLCTEVSQLIGDYLDSDDNIQERGMESSDYEDQMMAPLPRNEAMQFREELLYIKDFTKLFPLDGNGRLTLVRLIPPVNTSSLGGTPSLYSAGRKEVELLLPELMEDEVDLVMEALDKWRQEKILLTDTLDEELLAKVSGAFATTESGAYTVVVSAAPDDNDVRKPFRKLVFTYAGFEVSGPANQQLKYMEWNFL